MHVSGNQTFNFKQYHLLKCSKYDFTLEKLIAFILKFIANLLQVILLFGEGYFQRLTAV